MGKNKRSNRKWIPYLIVYLFAALPRIFTAANMLPLRTLSDETSTFSSAAMLAGHDWSGVVSHAGYYGFGFYWIFAWIFKITENPIIIYRTVLIFCSLLQALIAPICLFISMHFFHINKSRRAVLFSIVCAYCVVTRITVIYNEHPFVLLAWLVALIMCFLTKTLEEDDKLKRKIYSFLLGILLCWGFTIHTRAVIFVIALFLVHFLYKMLWGRWLLDKVFWVTIGIGYLGTKYLIRFYQNGIWGKSEGLRNANISISFSKDFTDINTWRTLVNIWIGQIDTVSVFSGGLFWVSFCVFLFFAFNLFRKRNIVNLTGKYVFVVGSLFILCIGGTIFAQSFTWFGMVVDGIKNNITESEYYGYKAFTYVRYFGPYIGPFMLCGLTVCNKGARYLGRIRWWIWGGYTALLLYWMISIQPLIALNDAAKEIFIFFSGRQNGDPVTEDLYIAGFVVLTCFMVAWMAVLLYPKRQIILCGGLLILLIAEYLYPAFQFDKKISVTRYEKVDKIYEYIKNEEPDKFDNEKIYCVDVTKATDHQIYYILQFYLCSYTVIPADIGNIPQNAEVIVSNGGIGSSLPDHDFQVEKLKDGQYIYRRAR